jgi:uncharacterized protein (TIGR02246 family)
MKILWISLLPIALILFACTAPASEPPAVDDKAQREADTQAIKEVEAKWDAATNANDADGIMALLTDDIIVVPPNAPAIEGKEAVRRFLVADFEENSYKDTKGSVVEVRLAGDWAYVRGTWRGTVTPKAGGESSEDIGQWIEIFDRQPDGSWKISRNMYSSDLPLPEAP